MVLNIIILIANVLACVIAFAAMLVAVNNKKFDKADLLISFGLLAYTILNLIQSYNAL